jgi:mannitol/fructose-specific phosphotransferase system IIA component (Ntr-type)
MRLADKLRPELVLIAPDVGGRDELFRLFGSEFERSGMVPDGDLVVEKLLEREQILSTGIGGGVAVPHAQVSGIGQLAMAVSIHPAGIDYPALDDEPVRLVFCLIGDSSTAADHLAGLARLARLARRGDALDRLVRVDTGETFLAVLAELEGA